MEKFVIGILYRGMDGIEEEIPRGFGAEMAEELRKKTQEGEQPKRRGTQEGTVYRAPTKDAAQEQPKTKEAARATREEPKSTVKSDCTTGRAGIV